MIAEKHRCVSYYAHYTPRKLFGIDLPLTMAHVVRCEQRNSHCLENGVRNANAVHEAAHPIEPNARIEWKERGATASLETD